jgi:hypothetical protein
LALSLKITLGMLHFFPLDACSSVRTQISFLKNCSGRACSLRMPAGRVVAHLCIQIHITDITQQVEKKSKALKDKNSHVASR